MIAGIETDSHQHNPILLGGNGNTSSGTLANGQNLPAGSVLGRVTSSGELVLATAGAGNGSDVPVGVLVHDIDASGGATGCQFYISGDINTGRLNWDASFTEALQAGAFDGTPINLVTPN